jgi:hypothetical protein
MFSMPNASAQAEMAECPFCQREVDAELVAYGGKCPHCFGEIPGEEAPTDPGEAKKKAEQKAIAAKVQRGRTLPLLIIGLMPVVMVCAAVGFVLKPVPPMPLLNLDEGDFSIGDVGELVAAPPEVPKPVEDVKNPTKGEKIAKLTPPKGIDKGVDPSKIDFGGSGTSPDGSPRGTHNGGTGTGSDLVVDPTKPLSVQNNGGGLLGGPGIGIERRAVKGVTLTDDNQIIEMVKLTVKEQLPKLRYQCYEPILKVEPDVAGSWIVNFTVKADGTVKDASAVAKEGTAGHSKLESCIAQKVSAWPFQPIRSELPVAKSVGFKAS